MMGGISSMDMNRIIRAVNSGGNNPLKDREECCKFYNSIMDEKKVFEKEHPEMPCIFSLVEPDDEEEEKLMRLLPDADFEASP